MSEHKFGFRTRALHAGATPDATTGARAVPIYQTTSFVFDDTNDAANLFALQKYGNIYSRIGNPTVAALEERIASLEGGLQCLLVPSGLAAIATVSLSLLKTGDEVLIPDNAYGPGKDFANGELARFGITHAFYDPLDPADLAARITSATRLVWLEAPGSVSMEFPDLCEQVRICRARGVTTALDNTWGAGLAFAPFDLTGDGSLGVDISAHALTKYPSGGGDVLMGSVITRDLGLHMKIKLTHMRLGLGVGVNDVEAVLRALPSIGLRYRAHDEAARVLARWLQQQPAVAQVLHPALEGAPGHAHWKALCGAAQSGQGAAAGLFSVMIDARYTQQQVDAFCDGLRLFKLGYSWGGPMSLVVPYTIGGMRSRPPQHLKPGTLVRFSIGLEAVEDLQRDLQQAIERAFPAA